MTNYGITSPSDLLAIETIREAIQGSGSRILTTNEAADVLITGVFLHHDASTEFCPMDVPGGDVELDADAIRFIGGLMVRDLAEASEARAMGILARFENDVMLQLVTDGSESQPSDICYRACLDRLTTGGLRMGELTEVAAEDLDRAREEQDALLQDSISRSLCDWPDIA